MTGTSARNLVLLGVALAACEGTGGSLLGPGRSTNDTTAPTVVSTSPAAGAVLTSIPASISATFSEPVDAATVSTTSFVVRIAGVLVPGTVSASGATATFTPSGVLDFDVTVDVTLTTDIRDRNGNPLAAVFTWSFTTPATP